MNHSAAARTPSLHVRVQSSLHVRVQSSLHVRVQSSLHIRMQSSLHVRVQSYAPPLPCLVQVPNASQQHACVALWLLTPMLCAQSSFVACPPSPHAVCAQSSFVAWPAPFCARKQRLFTSPLPVSFAESSCAAPLPLPHAQDFDPSQLWLLAEWLLSDTAGGVRESIVSEIARMVDAVAAGDVRKRIADRCARRSWGGVTGSARPAGAQSCSAGERTDAAPHGPARAHRRLVSSIWKAEAASCG